MQATLPAFAAILMIRVLATGDAPALSQPTSAVTATVVAEDSLALEPVSQVSGISLSGAIQSLAGGRFRIVLSQPAPTNLAIQYVVSGSATSGADYVAIAGTLTIPAGTPSGTIDITGIDDSQVERDETIVITLAPGQGYSLGTASTITARVVLVDSDQSIQLTATDARAAEPGPNAGSVQLERMGTLRGRLAVPLTLGGSATNGIDYTTLPDSIVFPDGQAIVGLAITPRADGTAEGQENVLVRVAGVPFQPASGVSVDIADASVCVTTSVSSVIEGQGNAATFVFTRSGDLTAAATVTFTVGGSATNGTDYNTIATSASFAAGAATATVPVVLRGDVVVEGAETIMVTVQPGSTLAPGSPNRSAVTDDGQSSSW